MELVDFAEQGLIGTIIVKDHSRLGKNRLIVGQLLEEDFVRWVFGISALPYVKGTKFSLSVCEAGQSIVT